MSIKAMSLRLYITNVMNQQALQLVLIKIANIPLLSLATNEHQTYYIAIKLKFTKRAAGM